ncbi:MAG TPA: IPT/TIG domain-containing protein, partial [Terracidiphilus sp.]
VSGLSPSSVAAGGADLPLTVNGANFDATSVAFWGATALATTVAGSSQLTALVPAALTANSGSANVTVSTDGGTSNATAFTILPPPPTLSVLSPSSAIAGGAAFTLTITGTNFSSASKVYWNTCRPLVTFISSTQLLVAIPPSLISSAGTSSLTVSTASGSSSGAIFTINPPAPTITSLSPANAYAGGAPFTLTVNGTNFTSTWTLWWGSTELPSTFKSSTQLTALVPPALIASMGSVAISVSTSTGRSSAAVFTINLAAPTVSSLSPSSTVSGGSDLLLTINGTNFDAASAAFWGTTALATTVISSTQLTAIAPAALTALPGTGSITVTTDGGASSAISFTILPQPPTVSSLSPSMATAGGAAFTLTISGTNFTTASKALWNSSQLSTTYVSSTQLTAAVPACLITAAGTPGITVNTAGGVSPAASFTINPPAPKINSLSPSTAVAGSAAYTLIINGSNFTPASTVQLNATALAVTYVSATQVTASVPASLIASAGTASVTVSNMTGTSSCAAITIYSPLPTIASLTPNSVLTSNGAFTMTVYGTNFQPGTSATVVRWNYTALATTFVSSTQLTAAVPASLLSYGSTFIYVISPSGISTGFPFTVIPPPPTITAMSMTQVPAGYGTFSTNIYGTYFTSTMVLNWGSTQLSGTLVGGTTFTFTVPANLIATAGPVSLTVTTLGGTSAPVTFTVMQPFPTITSLSPASIPAGYGSFPLIVNGTNFVSGMNLMFGSKWVGASVISSTQLITTIPGDQVGSAGAVNVIAYANKQDSPAVPFTIIPSAPMIASLSSYSATAGTAGFMLTVMGSAFTTTSTAMWGNTPLNTLYVSPTQLTAVVPANLIGDSGSASISVLSTAGSSFPVTFLITPATPSICGLSPAVAMAGGNGFSMTINGEYFTPSTSSTWGSTPLTTTYVSSTQLTVLVPARLIASAGTANITVTTAEGTSPSATFTISGPPVISTTKLPAGSAGLPYSGNINVSGGVPGYAWTVTGLPSSFSYNNTSGGTLTITGIPASTGKFILQVSAQDTVGAIAGPVSLTINVTAGPSATNNSNLNGSYTCLLQGSIDDDSTRWASILNFQADGQGNFSNGIFDTNSYDIGSASGILSGSYSIGSDNNGQASIHTILTNNAAGVQTTLWAIALTSSAQPATEFRMVEDDDLGELPSGQQGSASCYLATPGAFTASTISGSSFAFGLNGEDNNGNLKATAGQFSASNGQLTRGALDTTMGGSATDQNLSFTGSYTAPDPVWGRFTIALSGAGSSTGYTVYIIDASRMLILDNTSDDGEQAGNLRAQQPAAFTATALNGSFALYAHGAQFAGDSGIPSSFYANLLVGAGDGAGNITIRQSYANNAGTYLAGGSDGGPTALAFDPVNPGRASFQTASGTTYLYFYGANRAFELSVGKNGSVDSGSMEAQAQNALTSAALTGNYLFGELPSLSVQPTSFVGEYSLNSSGGLAAGLTTSAQGILSWDQSLSTTYAWDTTATGTGGFFITSGALGKASCATISATRVACIPQT